MRTIGLVINQPKGDKKNQPKDDKNNQPKGDKKDDKVQE